MGMMINRRRACGGKSLPYDAEIEYLESTGTQWIDTGIYGDINTKVIIRFNPSSLGGVVFGSRESATSRNIAILGGLDTDKQLLIDFGNYQYTRTAYPFPSISGHWYEAINCKNLRRITDLNTYTYYESTTLFTDSFTTPRTLKICFKDEGMYYTYNNFEGKISMCQLYNNNTLILDLIPVRVGSVGYMYDKVSKQLFGNSGTGAFILGPDKVVLPSGYKKLKYIESTGTQWIDTGVLGSLATSYEILALTTVANNTPHILFGARQSFNTANIGTHFISDSSNIVQDFGDGNATRVTAIHCVKDRIYTVYNSATLRFVRDESTGNEQRGTTTYSLPFTTPVALRLFTGYGFSASVSSFEGRVYYCKIWDNGVLVRNFIPYKNPNNVVGMYDTVNGVFYSSPNGTAFIAGPAV